LHQAAIRSSFSAPRITILIAPSGNVRCSASLQPKRPLAACYIQMKEKERTALLEQAARCRGVAAEIDQHRKAAERLIAMAIEYEKRAAIGASTDSAR
jgi:hypothetical protein